MTKLTIIILTILLSLNGHSIGVNKYTTSDHGVSHSKSYGYTTSTEIVRKGNKSQRFEIRHGDCGTDGEFSDCDHDRRRIERYVEPISSEKPEGVVWYSYSLYLPDDFQALSPTNTVLGQVKLTGYSRPLWNLIGGSRGVKIKFGASRKQSCRLIKFEDMLGQWTDFLIKADYSTGEESDKLYSEVYVNGKDMDCGIDQPVLTKQILSDRKKNKKMRFNFRYGIYNSYVSLWLDEWGTKSPDTSDVEYRHRESGMVAKNVTNKPWEFDWGVKLPTQVVYYDEIRIGPTRESVDINLNNEVD